MSLTSPQAGAQTHGPSPEVPMWQISSSKISGSSSWSEVKQVNHPPLPSPLHHRYHHTSTSCALVMEECINFTVTDRRQASYQYQTIGKSHYISNFLIACCWASS